MHKLKQDNFKGHSFCYPRYSLQAHTGCIKNSSSTTKRMHHPLDPLYTTENVNTSSMEIMLRTLGIHSEMCTQHFFPPRTKQDTHHFTQHTQDYQNDVRINTEVIQLYVSSDKNKCDIKKTSFLVLAIFAPPRSLVTPSKNLYIAHLKSIFNSSYHVCYAVY